MEETQIRRYTSKYILQYSPDVIKWSYTVITAVKVRKSPAHLQTGIDCETQRTYRKDMQIAHNRTEIGLR